MWILNDQFIDINDEFIFSRQIQQNINKIIVECSVLDKPRWNFAGHAFVTDNEIKPISFQNPQEIWLEKPQLILVDSRILEILSGYFIILFEPKKWVADYGFNLRIYIWQQ